MTTGANVAGAVMSNGGFCMLLFFSPMESLCGRERRTNFNTTEPEVLAEEEKMHILLRATGEIQRECRNAGRRGAGSGEVSLTEL